MQGLSLSLTITFSPLTGANASGVSFLNLTLAISGTCEYSEVHYRTAILLSEKETADSSEFNINSLSVGKLFVSH